jgi:photosystem II Psb27 protein
VRATLTLDKSDPGRGDAVKALRDSSNQWVAKYRREKRFAGKPSYSNIYSVLNAVSGHYISYGDGAPLPAKRKTQILEEVETAEKALNRGR